MGSLVQRNALIVILLAFTSISCVSATFWRDFTVPWGRNNAHVRSGGHQMDLNLDNSTGCLMSTNQHYLFGKFDVKIKLAANNSAGTVTTFYMSSKGTTWDEIDIEFLGNTSGEPYLLHTNIFVQGKGNREQQFHLWFDPSAKYHIYSIVWTPKQIIILVDGIPLRIFGNYQSQGMPFPTTQRMKVHASIWNGDSWATQGGRVKIDWTRAPFVANYRTFTVTPCTPSSGGCTITSTDRWWNTVSQSLAPSSRRRLSWVQKNFMVYDFCKDQKRFPTGFPKECFLPVP